MIYHLATLLFAPILMAQGIYVRRFTPKLPEPEGHRSGVYGEGSRITLLIVGDSAAAGVGAGTQYQALSGRLVTALGTSYQVSWKLLAQTGDASSHVLARLEREINEKFDVVVISVGVNDVTARTSSKEWLNNLKRMTEILKSKFHARHIILSAVPPMHLFPALPQPLRWWLGLKAKSLNSILERMAGHDDDCSVLPMASSFERHYMANDGFHPGEAAYTLWGNELAKVIRAAL